MKVLRCIAPAVFVCCAMPAMAACPDPALPSVSFATTGPDLIAPKSWDVVAQGTQAAPCEDWRERGITTGGLSGFLPQAPSVIFELDQMAPHILVVTARADCGPVLAVRSGDGQWFFGETQAEGRQDVTLWGAPNGPLQVWVGAQDVAGCDGTVTLETFDR